MNTLQKQNWQCDGWKYIYDANDTQATSDICEMVGLDDDTRRKNARLICAAPVMMEALRYVIDNVDNEDVVEKCVAAFMKAQGLKMEGNIVKAL
jgi:hypothetical protein